MQIVNIVHSFGSSLSSGIRNAVFFVKDDEKKDNQKILYPTGKFLAKRCKQPIDGDRLEFVKLQQSMQGLGCIAVSNRRRQVATFELIRGVSQFQIWLYQLDKGKCKLIRPSNTQLKASTCKCLAFANSQKNLVALTGQPQFALLYIQLQQRPRVVSIFSNNFKDVSKIQINPNNSSLVSLSGKNIMKVYRLQEYQFKLILDSSLKLPKRNFTDHVWLDQTRHKFFLVSTDRGQVFLINLNGQIKQEIVNAFDDKNIYNITCLKSTQRSFIAASDRGTFALWQLVDHLDHQEDHQSFSFNFYRRWACSEYRCFSVTSLDLDEKESQMLVGFQSNDIGLIDMTQLKSNLTQQTYTDNSVKIKYLYRGFHKNTLSSLQTCLHRPLIASCCREDNTIRIWNYKNPSCQLLKLFSFKSKQGQIQQKSQSPINCISLHPSGYYLAAAFLDNLNLFYITSNALKPYRQIMLKGCVNLKFSNGGQMLAAAYPKLKSTNYLINIYNSYTKQQLFVLPGHSNQIRDMQFSNNDHQLFTCSLDSVVSQWDLRTGYNRVWGADPSFKYNSLVQYNHQKNSIILALANLQDKKCALRQITLFEKQENQKLTFLGHSNANKLKFLRTPDNQTFLVIGGEDGAVRFYPLPFDGKNQTAIHVHSSPIVQLACSPCGRYIFTSGQQGIIFVLSYGTLSRQKGLQISVVEDSLADLVLFQKLHIQQSAKQIRNLKTSVEDLQSKIAEMAQEQQRNLKQERQKLNDELNRTIAMWNSRYESLKEKMSSVQAQKENSLKKQEKMHRIAVNELEMLYQQKLKCEYEKQHKYKQDLKSNEVKQESDVKQRESDFESKLIEQNRLFQQKIEVLKDDYRKLMDYVVGLQLTYGNNLQQIQKKYQAQISHLQQQHKSELEMKNLKIKELFAQRQNNRSKKKLDQQQFVDQKLSNQKLLLQKNKLQEKVKFFSKQVQEKDALLLQRAQAMKANKINIRDQQNQIQDLRKQAQIHNYKTSELRKCLQPMQHQIQELTQRLQASDSQKQRMVQDLQQQRNKQEHNRTVIQVLRVNLKEQVLQTKEKEERLNQLIMEIHRIVSDSQPRKNYIKEIGKLHEKYVINNIEVSKLIQDKKGISQTQRQITYLQKTVEQMKKNSEKTLKRRNDQLIKKTRQNVQLLLNLNQISKQYKTFQSNLKDKEKKLLQSEEELKKVKNNMFAIAQNNRVDQRSLLRRAQSAKPTQFHRQPRPLKGSNFNQTAQNSSIRSQLLQVVSKLKECDEQLRSKERLIERMLTKVKDHIRIKGCSDLQLTQMIANQS